MKKYALCMLAIVLTTLGSSQIRMTMVNPENHEIQIKNFGLMTVDISSYRLCARFDYQILNQAAVAIVTGDFNLSPNESVTLTWLNSGANGGFQFEPSDLGLYLPSGSFGSATNMVDFMQYGAGGQGREPVAVAGGRWTAGDFLVTSTGPWMYTGDGTQNGMMFWSEVLAPGCTDSAACNYMEAATEDDGTCEYPGCPIPFACNYNPSALCFEESLCVGEPGSPCDDGDPLTMGETYDDNCNCVLAQSLSVFDIIAESPIHNTLETAIITAGLDGALSSPGELTVFAPTDAAFANLPVGTIPALLADTTGLLQAILLYHTAGAMIPSTVLENGMIIPTLQGQNLLVTINNDGVFINDAQVIAADIVGVNGIVHVIDAVLLPQAPAEFSIFEIVDASTDHTILQTALEATGLDIVLSEPGTYTLFAPTNSAFDALPLGTLETLLADTNGALANILLYHTLGSEVPSQDLADGAVVETLQGQDVIVTINASGIFINNAQVTIADLNASNGVVHVIDAVLLPAAEIIPGCTDITACNYDSQAGVDDFTCIYPDCTLPEACNYNPQAGCPDDNLCDLSGGCTDPSACNFSAVANCDNGTCQFPASAEISVAIDSTGFAVYNDSILAPGEYTFVFLAGNGCDSLVMVTVFNPNSFGCLNPFACNYDATAGVSDSTLCILPACKDIAACNYDSLSICDGGTCYYLACNDPAACNYEADAFCQSSGVCEYSNEIYNCSGECISDQDADGVCDILEVIGCSDPDACNYIPAATEAGFCSYPTETYLDCFGNCLNDNNNNALCDEIELEGCTDPGACNYNADANIENLTCLYPGCTDSTACNYNENASCSDNSCELPGCTNPDACNYNPLAICDDGLCSFPGCTDITACNYDFTSGCDDNSCVYPGCTNPDACNYLSTAACDDSSCVFGGCTEMNACNFNPNAGCEDGSCEFPGCNDETACNYNPTVGCGDNSCIYTSAQSILDCDGNCLNDLNSNGVCDELENTYCSDSTACNYSLTGLDSTCFYSGCSDPTSCNYNESAACDDSTCVYPGCTEIAACNYDSSALCDNGLCEFPGCTSPDACNFDFYAVCDDSSCEYPSCTDPDACNFDPNATCDGGVCIAAGCLDTAACNYDSSAGCDNGSCVFPGCTDVTACNFSVDAGCDDGSCSFNTSETITIEASQDSIAAGIIFGGDTITSEGEYIFSWVSAAGCDSIITLIVINTSVEGCLDESACNYNPFAGISADSVCLYPGCTISGSCNYDLSAGCDDGSCISASCADAAACNYDSLFVCVDTNLCLYGSSGCTDPAACNYDSLAVCDNNSCIFSTVIYDCNGNCNFDNDNDGICDQFEIVGCLDTLACNYNNQATEAGVCEYPAPYVDCSGACLNDINNNALCDETEISGCTDVFACNYDASATLSDTTCSYPEEYLNCNGECLLDADNDGICDQLDSVGCTITTACNYNSFASVGDSTCTFPGCTDSLACNFDVNAGCDDGNCSYPGFIYNCQGLCFNDNDSDGVCNEFEILGCTDLLGCNYDSLATDAGNCEYPEAFRDCSGICINDSDNDGVCDEEELAGCYDITACNYEPLATDTGICEYAALYFDCAGNCLQDADGDSICDQLEVAGCIDSTACNYNAFVTISDSTCSYPGCLIPEACNYDTAAGCNVDSLCSFPETYYDCDGLCVNDADADGVCDIFDTTGCTIFGACNYNPLAFVADSSCTFPGCLTLGACNYDPAAPCHIDSLCIIPEIGYDCTGSCISDADNDGVCDIFETTGCTDPEACNYNANVTSDDGSCSFNSEATVNITVDQSEYPNGYVWQGEIFTSSGTYLYIIPNEAGCDSLITLNLTITVGVNEVTNTAWIIWPNPAREYLNISGHSTIEMVTILDVMGNMVTTEKYVGTIDVSGLASGVYILQIKSAAGIESKRFEISH